MNAKVSFFVLLLAVAVVSSKRISYQSCSSSSLVDIRYMDLTPCDEEPCVLRRGSKETVKIGFIPHEVITEARIYAYGIFRGMRIPLPLQDRDVCQGYGLTCPLKSGVPAELVYNLEVKRMFPSGNYKLEALIKDQNNNLVICGIVDLKLA